MIGLKRGIVQLAPYNEEWIRLCTIEVNILTAILKGNVVDIQHIGSTSIPGMCAKPIIDILVGVISLSKTDDYVEVMEQNGYIRRKDSDSEERQLFVKGEEDYRTHHIHIVEWNGDEWKRHIFFRDYLRKDKEAAQAYTSLKEELAKRYFNDRVTYTDSKNNFIQNILRKGRF